MRFLPVPRHGRGRRRVSFAQWLPHCWAVLLAVVLLGPVLGGGFVLSFDMVFVPDLALRSDFLGLGTAQPRAVPSDAIVSLLDEVVPGMVLQKAVLLGALVLAAFGVLRLVGPSVPARMVAVSVTIWNPFVVERLWIGHWPVLLGYAAVPWLVLAGRRSRLEGGVPVCVCFLLPLGSLSASAGLVSALVLLVSAWARPGRTAATLVALCVAVNAPWWVAGLLHADAATIASGFDVFGLRAEGSLPAPLAALGLGGIWNSDVVPASREGALAWLALGALVGLAALGARRWWQREGSADCWRLVTLWGLGYLLAVVSWLSPDVLGWTGSHVPGGGLLRDGTRSLALCLPLLVSLVASGAESVVARGPGVLARGGLAVACVLLPVAVMPDVAWGLGGALRPVDFPPSYAIARSEVARADDGGGGDVLLLPFSSFRAPAWNGGRTVLDPLGRFLQPNFLASDELSISGRILAGEDPRVLEVQAALALDRPEDRATALGGLGVQFVARQLDAPGAGDPAYDAEIAGETRYEGQQLEITEITAGMRAREVSTSSKLGMGLGWAGLLGTLLLGFARLARCVWPLIVTRGETTARVRG